MRSSVVICSTMAAARLSASAGPLTDGMGCCSGAAISGSFLDADEFAVDAVGDADAPGLADLLGVLIDEHAAPDLAAVTLGAERAFARQAGRHLLHDVLEEH